MNTRSNSANPSSLGRLFLPICLETFCMMLAGMIDTLMLSSVGDLAVGAVGTANTYINQFIVMLNIASTGMVAVMTQYIGAGKNGIASKVRRCGLAFNTALGTLLSLTMLFFSSPLLSFMGIAQNIAEPTEIYLRIVGGGCLTTALIPVFSGHLRAFGHTRQPFLASIVGNIVNLILNAVFLYIFDMGVAGVAAATVISRVLNLVLVSIASYRLNSIKHPCESIPVSILFKQILRIGIPSACENIVYSISITILVSLLNQMDTSGFHISARSYALQFTCFSHCVSSALGQANAIMTGWFVGAGRFDECNRNTKRAAIYASISALFLGCAIAFLSRFYIPFFTNDIAMLKTILILLEINIPLEIGRAVNVCYGNALKASGDARFPMAIGALFMLLFGSAGTWFFGSKLGIAPAVACFIGMCMDECTRAALMIFRWRRGTWQKKVFI